MQVQHHNVHLPRSVQARVARMVLQANLAYGESNSNRLSYIQRLQARNECRGYLEQALALEADHAVALGLFGRVEMDDGQLEKAHALFNASLNSQPGQSQQYCNLGYWALKCERPALAEEFFLKALECDRQSAAAFCGVAHAKRLQGQFDVAYLHYRTLLRSGSDWDSVYSGMLTCAQHLNIHQADADLAQDAIALLSQDGLPHQEIGRFVAAVDLTDSAVTLAYVARAVTPGDFAIPGVVAEDMYRPEIFARSAPGRVTIARRDDGPGGTP